MLFYDTRNIWHYIMKSWSEVVVGYHYCHECNHGADIASILKPSLHPFMDCM